MNVPYEGASWSLDREGGLRIRRSLDAFLVLHRIALRHGEDARPASQLVHQCSRSTKSSVPHCGTALHWTAQGRAGALARDFSSARNSGNDSSRGDV
ncbi:hypothetical protein MPTK1_3g05080 [Marchantia polymorpha subsp. ruderalis]|uniref:Uncharacterized protein n=2 Tax=Marchantia polymorpha TaxID=3197 RepID=A0AAF6AXK4_MARPO|nr:hypothetical protein MARPO_0022s0020 [Marchantia polymorpha]BBN04488.1 hypothetical protein Mp_3g05080 [Marchantia polymorpha subsp. ruderalis]|eukprot:PTQ43912.1 hypothetical protein MARPO_0022s0020 [Marchantia polymorpha]